MTKLIKSDKVYSNLKEFADDPIYEIEMLKKTFKMTDTEEISTYLGMEYKYSRDEDGYLELRVNQTAYVNTLIKRFDLEDKAKYRYLKRFVMEYIIDITSNEG